MLLAIEGILETFTGILIFEVVFGEFCWLLKNEISGLAIL